MDTMKGDGVLEQSVQCHDMTQANRQQRIIPIQPDSTTITKYGILRRIALHKTPIDENYCSQWSMIGYCTFRNNRNDRNNTHWNRY